MIIICIIIFCISCGPASTLYAATQQPQVAPQTMQMDDRPCQKCRECCKEVCECCLVCKQLTALCFHCCHDCCCKKGPVESVDDANRAGKACVRCCLRARQPRRGEGWD